MNKLTSHPKTTPRRNRQRQNGRIVGQKAYASENDVGSFEVGHYRAPHTPSSKAQFQSSPAPGGRPSTQTNSKQRSRNGGELRGKVTSGSSDVQNEKITPTARRASTKSNLPAAAAFAGATFHASPAPSALPIPSFLSKPSNYSDGSAAQRSGRQVSPPAVDSDTAIPYLSSAVDSDTDVPYSSSAQGVTESPLDFMFRAHRQEKERIFGSPHHGSRDSPLFFGLRAGNSPQTPVPHTAPPCMRRKNGGVDQDVQLDGTPELDTEPACWTVHHERVKATCAPGTSGASSQQLQRDMTAAGKTSSDDATFALKKFLFGDSEKAARSPLCSSCTPIPTPTYRQGSADQAGNSRSNRKSNIKAMENDLRRILKLDSS